MARTSSEIITDEKGYQAIVNNITMKIQAMPKLIIKDLFEIHKEGTRHALQAGKLRPKAYDALWSNIEYQNKDVNELKIFSMSEVGAFFEFGVKEHFIARVRSDGKTPTRKVSGRELGDWMDRDSEWLQEIFGFKVGTAGTILDKSNPLAFMWKGYEKAWNNSPSIVNKYLQQI